MNPVVDTDNLLAGLLSYRTVLIQQSGAFLNKESVFLHGKGQIVE